MKKIILILLLGMTGCVKERRDAIITVPRGTIVTCNQKVRKDAVMGPYRIDSLAAPIGSIDNSNWYWTTSDNGVRVEQSGYYLVNCPDCKYDWVGPAKWVPNALTNGQSLLPL